MIKNLRLLLLLMTFVLPIGLNAQCVPNPPSTVPGFYPNPVPEACVNQSYTQAVDFVFPLDTTVTLPPFGTFTLPFDSFRIDNISNVPAGMTFNINSATNMYYPGGPGVAAMGCADLLGTPTTANTYQDSIVIVLTAWSTAPIVGVQSGQDTLRVNLKVNPEPVAAFTFLTTALQADFTNTTAGMNTYSWDFGDGNTSTTMSPSHTYSAPGNYNVCLTADDGNCQGTTCQTVTVGCAAPTSNFTSSPTNLMVGFNNTTVGTVTSQLWDFGDGNTDTGASPMHTYTTPGTYTVCLTSTNVCGSDSMCASVTVCSAMAASFSETANLLDVDFVDGSTGDITGWAWDFGDGNTSTLQNPMHTYAAAGTYNVCLTTTDACGTDSSCSSVTVIAVGMEAAQIEQLNAWPNPAMDVLRIAVPVNTEGISLELTDLTGKVLLNQEMAIGQATTSMDLKALAAGSYFLVAKTATSQKAVKVQVMR